MSDDDKYTTRIANALASHAKSDQAKSPLSLGLAGLWTRPEVRGLYYNGQTIQIDGYKFVGCRFDNCVLQVNTDNFEFIQCIIDESTKIVYSNNLSKIIKLFLGRYKWALQYFPSYFTPTQNHDGSETISDQGR